MKDQIFTRSCPICKSILTYKTRKSLKVAENKNTKCYSCANSGTNHPLYGKTVSESTRNKLSKSNSGKKRTKDQIDARKRAYVEGKLGICKINKLSGKDHPNFGRCQSTKTKNILSKYRKGVPITQQHRDNISKAQIGFKHSEETKRKQRISKINYILTHNGGIRPSYNSTACKWFELLEEKTNWNGMFAKKNKEYHIKELGYFVDYYEPNLNVVIEYDEPIHYYSDNTLKEKDITRMKSIVDFLKCRFIRYNEKNEQLYEYKNERLERIRNLG